VKEIELFVRADQLRGGALKIDEQEKTINFKLSNGLMTSNAARAHLSVGKRRVRPAKRMVLPVTMAPGAHSEDLTTPKVNRLILRISTGLLS
jgi:hypothetical protein